ncbi:MAG: NlpC/P60 family protein [Rhodospirillaceae bacterium]
MTAPDPMRQVCVGHADLKSAPARDAGQTSQVLFGEHFTVFDETDGYARGRNETDGYSGHVACSALGSAITEPTHRVAALRTFLYPGPDLKLPVRDALSLTSPVHVIGERNGFAELAGGGWVFAAHLAPLERVETDIAATALRLLGVPYLWGGRTSLGIDCSGLVQIALGAAGIAAPRDSHMQRTETGVSLGPVPADGAGLVLRRGDLVFFPGHVGIMIDETRLVHATAFVMAVTVEPLANVVARTDPTRGGGLIAARRI